LKESWLDEDCRDDPIQFLIEQTGALIHTHVVEPIERTPDTAESVKAQTAFASILGQLARARRQTSSGGGSSLTGASDARWATNG
jgi:hypothetical protein